MKDIKNYMLLESEEAEVEKEETKELSEMPEEEKYGVIQTGG